MTNPFMSMWLSALNSAAGQARGLWTAEAYRQQAAAMKAMTDQTIRFWTEVWKLPTSRK